MRMEQRTDGNTGIIQIPKNVFPSLPDECKFIFLQKEGSSYLTIYPTKDLNTAIYKLYVEVEWGTLGSFVRRFTNSIKQRKKIRFIPELSQGCPGKKGEPCIFHGFLLGEDEGEMDDFISDISDMKIDDSPIILKTKLMRIS